MRKYPCLFGDVPSRPDVLEHDIDVGDAVPIKQRFYRASPDKLGYTDSEVEYSMIQNNIGISVYSGAKGRQRVLILCRF